MDYIESLFENFKEIKFEIVNFDNGNTAQSMQCYLIATNLSKELLKNKGSTALDLGNYIYRRFGFMYEMCPEYHRKDEPANSLSFYQNKEKFNDEKSSHLRNWILLHDKTKKRAESVLYDKHRLEIPHHEPLNQFVAIWKKTGETVILLKKISGSEIIFMAGKKEFRYMQCEIGPISDFEIICDL